MTKFKVEENRFEVSWVQAELGIPWFRNYTKNKIKTQLVDPKTDSVIYTPTDPEINGLKIIPSKITLDKKSKVFQISGKITGAWEDVSPGEFEIYIGYRNDTISNITLSPSCFLTTNRYNGAKLDSTIIVDRVSAFYLTNVKKFSAYWRTKNLTNSNYKDILFNISTVIDGKSILVFGLISRYAEIFEIGKLLSQ